MKKLTILLCACAVAVAALMVSCKNEPTEYINMTDTATDIYYKVSGTVVESRSWGTTTDTNISETTYTITDAVGYAYNYKSKTRDSNTASWYIQFQDPDAQAANTYKSGSTTSESKWWGSYSDYYTINKIDGDYYYIVNYKPFKVNVSGSMGGKEFKISFEYSNDDTRTNLTQAQKDDTTAVNKSSGKVELTFTKMN